MKTCLIALLALVALPLVNAESPTFAPVSAELIRPRDGLGNVLQKLGEGRHVRIAYLGGSITAANGWRVKSREWFSHEFPNADVAEIHAAIGGTGSDLGVFRVQRDALQYKPDLLFVEFAVNDGGVQPAQIWRAMEGIVRQTWAADSRTDICFVYTFRVGYQDDLQKGVNPRAASAMEMLADHYGIPSINFAKEIVAMETDGDLIFQSAEPTDANVIRFSSDGVHPLDEGHQIYAELVAEGVREIAQSSSPIDHRSKLVNAFVEDHWDAATMIPITSGMLSPEWQALSSENTLAKKFGNRLGTIWEATEPGSKLTFEFRGSTAKLYDLVGPDGGQVIITVDGKRRESPVPRFDHYCTYHRIATLTVASGLSPDDIHTVTVEVDSEQPDRQIIASRLQDPETELRAAKYQGTKFRVGQIMVLTRDQPDSDD
ncbi:SGNH/GDSL hydrolase family protein [Allorhodopirellula heiligendammensis]|uniref:SGNH hydrolase-type esterase domain-containing protein n=1 Tax=Allorhodopirellula heiligendammensis TaxID=2714739 RepID=A0A5C6C826_9BACT|nr:SGNH/GDSL hydrolase family protein [Allorhodopirellula heiligendammensis]TWU19576.1 hypothetical protein Poly21_17500 [Allorhodopirellula heiligendammensis]